MNLNKQQIFGLYYFAGYKKIQFNYGTIMADDNKQLYEDKELRKDWMLYGIAQTKLILRPFSDMTGKESEKWAKIFQSQKAYLNYGEKAIIESKATFYLLKIGICLNDEWFENGTAVNRKDLAVNRKDLK